MKFQRSALFAGVAVIALPAMAAIVTGRILDEVSDPLPGVNVKILTLPDSTYLASAATNIDGIFVLDSIPPGRHALTTEYFGLSAAPIVLRIDTENDSLPLPDIQMHDESKLLDDLIVTGYRSAVTAKLDTLEFNAGSFKTQQNAMVEDLLKKLSGVEVGTDGSLTSGGKTITKILVDGEEFFSDDPKVASRNLPADMVEKVQVIDRKSDLARLTGVDDGEEETVINLTIKKDRKNGWFGNASGGYGTDSRYLLNFNVNRFHNGNQYTILGSLNNINDLTFSDAGRGRFRGGGASLDGITTSRVLGFNFAVGSSDNLRVGGNILYSNSDQDYSRRADTQYLFPDSTSYENSVSSSRNKGHNLRGDFRMQWNISESDNLDLRAGASWNHRDVKQNDNSAVQAGDAQRTPVNKQDNFQKNSGNSYDANGEIIWAHKMLSHPGRAFSLQANYRMSNTRENATSWSDIIFYLSQDDSELLNRFINNHQWSNSIESRLTWTEPLGNPANGNFLNIAYRFRYNFNNADKLTYNLPIFEDEMTQEIFNSLNVQESDGEIDNTLSNRFRNNFLNQEVQLSYKKIHAMYDLEAGLVYVPSMSKSTDLINDARNIPTRWTHNVSPFLRFRYKFTKTRNLRINYRARTQQPTLTQLQPVADESNPLQIMVGNPDLKPTFTQNVNLMFSDFNSESQSSLMTMVRGSWSLNSIVRRTVSDALTGVQTTTYANLNNAFTLMGGIIYNRPLSKAHWRIGGDLFANYMGQPGYINGDLNRSGNLMLNVRPSLTYTMDLLQISARPQYSLQYTHNSLPMQPSRTVHSYGVSGDAQLTLPFGLEISSDIDYRRNTGYAAGYNTNVCLWNAQVSYSFLKNRSLTAALKVYDLLQQKNSISRTVAATYITDAQVNTLTRYVMLTLTWQFQSYGKGEDIALPGGPEFGPPPGEIGRRGAGMRPGGGRPMGPPPGL